MSTRPNQRWIASIVAASSKGVPPLPWERSAKLSRRLNRAAVATRTPDQIDPELSKFSNAHASIVA